MIKVLSDKVIAAIAAGEVIESPAQVVKELVENSLDAGAKNIKISLENGGLSQILVSDDGQGMSQKDLQKCWQRHATSKISSIKDLDKIRSLGFRGEALFSMASVSGLTIQTRQPGERVGFCLQVKNGQELGLRPMGLPEGTTVIVRNLFASVPARLKFLSDPSKEYQKVLQVVTKLALGYPQISFALEKDGKLMLNLPAEKLTQRVEMLLGNEYDSQLLSFEQEEEPLKIKGFISRPQYARKSKKHQFIFINQRLVEDSDLSDFVRALFGDLLDDKSYPQLLLHLELPEQYLDVNIHPQKLRVEFADKDEVLKFVGEVITKVLKDADLIYSYQEQQELKDKLFARNKKADKKIFAQLKSETQTFDVRKLGEDEILQVARTYLLYQRGSCLVLVDQHAAHEKVLFEEFKAEFAKKKLKTKKLKKAVSIKLGAADQDLLKSSLEGFEKLGFKIKVTAKKVSLSQVPELFADRDFGELIKELLDNLRENKSMDMDQKSLATLEFLSCRGAIKAGDYLSPQERKKLIEKLEESKELYTCPHGRPLKIELGLNELEKMFHRH
jgi:DNA mismatch repair protein MutL